MNIVIVDDIEENRYLLESMLKGRGYTVRPASNGAEALDILKEGGIDLIISDILMPVMDGFQLCRKVKTDETLRTIPFIIYTATYTGPKDETFALKIGADRFIEKPCEPEIFMNALDEVLSAAKHAGDGTPVETIQEEEALKLYSERLVRKLEQKVLEAEREIKARKEAEEALLDESKRLSEAIRAANIGLWDWDLVTDRIKYSTEWKQQIGYAVEEISDSLEEWKSRIHPDDLKPTLDRIQWELSNTRKQFHIEFRFRHKDCSYRWILAQASVYCAEDGQPVRVLGSHIDITDRKHAEEEREKLQAQIAQAQRMEAIGRLAGGVAHDFNNMLSIILGSIELILQDLPADSPLQSDLDVIRNAAERSAVLTRQLLAFARRQTVEPRVLDLNATIESMFKMLARLIGEDIDLQWKPADTLDPVNIDPAQIDQILANLVVNARDAIDGVGNVTIETARVELDEHYCTMHPDCVQGRYVMLTISDTGCGMNEETLKLIFEPFFTTKKVGKGTGLGMATVFGIVKQNRGHIDIESEPGQGTTTRVYLPVYEPGFATKDLVTTPASTIHHEHETILFVEDDTNILDLGKRILEQYGYRVITASTPAEAIRLAKEHSGELHLLITDMVMPEMNGRELSRKLLALYPEIKCLFTSGYTADIISHHGILEEGVNFIQKPLTMKALREKVREVLDKTA